MYILHDEPCLGQVRGRWPKKRQLRPPRATKYHVPTTYGCTPSKTQSGDISWYCVHATAWSRRTKVAATAAES